jgi:hypothetical protein
VDEQIALNHGVLGQETTGAAGFSMAIRTIPVLMEYCELAKKLAPNAWIFNFSNPSGLVTQALRSAGYERVIGICDTPSHTKLRMAEALGIESKELTVEFFGINHLSWMSKAIYKGEDIMQKLKNDAAFTGRIEEFKMFDSDLLRSLPYLPLTRVKLRSRVIIFGNFQHHVGAISNDSNSEVTRMYYAGDGKYKLSLVFPFQGEYEYAVAPTEHYRRFIVSIATLEAVPRLKQKLALKKKTPL